ncbi:MerR-like helix-turn-helix DNA binding domain protein [Mycobacterium phage JacoRen57]|nr:MerR-like helix-turn-helix DNA binding domain protein [Mycobacterium phage JacoRen57]
MFTSDAAKLIGIKPKALRAFLRTHRKGVGSGSRYEFSYEEVEELAKEYWKAQRQSAPTKQSSNAWLGDGGRAGLPHEWLSDPAKEALFLAERQERLERMSARLREVGLDVPQMTEKDLKVNNRAIARAILQGDYSGE